MTYEFNTIIGSGSVASMTHSPPYNITAGTYPIPDKSHALRNRRGDGAIILNPEDFSVSIGIRNQSISVAATGKLLPTSPLENRRALVLHNNGPGILYIGTSAVSTSNGFPLAVNEKIGIDIMGTPNVAIYGVSDSTSDVRIVEFA